MSSSTDGDGGRMSTRAGYEPYPAGAREQVSEGTDRRPPSGVWCARGIGLADAWHWARASRRHWARDVAVYQVWRSVSPDSSMLGCATAACPLR